MADKLISEDYLISHGWKHLQGVQWHKNGIVAHVYSCGLGNAFVRIKTRSQEPIRTQRALEITYARCIYELKTKKK